MYGVRLRFRPTLGENDMTRKFGEHPNDGKGLLRVSERLKSEAPKMIEHARETYRHFKATIKDAGPDFQSLHMLLGVCLREIKRLTKERDMAEAHAQSLQNKWATRPPSAADEPTVLKNTGSPCPKCDASPGFHDIDCPVGGLPR